MSIKHEPNGDVRIEGDTAEEVEYEMNDVRMFAAGRGQQINFNGPNKIINGKYAAMGKVVNV